MWEACFVLILALSFTCIPLAEEYAKKKAIEMRLNRERKLIADIRNKAAERKLQEYREFSNSGFSNGLLHKHKSQRNVLDV